MCLEPSVGLTGFVVFIFCCLLSHAVNITVWVLRNNCGIGSVVGIEPG